MKPIKQMMKMMPILNMTGEMPLLGSFRIMLVFLSRFS